MEFGELATLDAHEDGADVKIKHPSTGKLTDVVIKVKGVDSKAWRKGQKTMQRAMIEELAAGNVDIDSEKLEIDALVAITIGWEGIVMDGKPFEFNAKNCRSLYTKAPHIRDQIGAFVGKRANFTQG